MGRKRQAERLGQSERVVERACQAQRTAQAPVAEQQDSDDDSLASGGLLDAVTVQFDVTDLPPLRIPISLLSRAGVRASPVLAGTSRITKGHWVDRLPVHLT